MPFLIFLGVIFAGLAGVLALNRIIERRRRGQPVEPIVRIASFNNRQLADLSRRTLTAAGIKSEPRGGPYFPARGEPQPLIGEWEIWVREKDADKARALLGID